VNFVCSSVAVCQLIIKDLNWLHNCRRGQRVRLLEEQLLSLSDELNAVTRQLEQQSASIGSDAVQQLERRLHRAEDELAAGDVLRDNLRANREQVCNTQISCVLFQHHYNSSQCISVYYVLYVLCMFVLCCVWNLAVFCCS